MKADRSNVCSLVVALLAGISLGADTCGPPVVQWTGGTAGEAASIMAYVKSTNGLSIVLSQAGITNVLRRALYAQEISETKKALLKLESKAGEAGSRSINLNELVCMTISNMSFSGEIVLQVFADDHVYAVASKGEMSGGWRYFQCPGIYSSIIGFKKRRVQPPQNRE